MEKSFNNGVNQDIFVVKLDPFQQDMTEKWMLVLIIVGSTSLIFLICFPIDFYLYRRRKRLARERSHTWYRPPSSPIRVTQAHAKVEKTNTSIETETEIDVVNEVEQRDHRAEKIGKVLKMFKDKTLDRCSKSPSFRERLTSATSEISQIQDINIDDKTRKERGCGEFENASNDNTGQNVETVFFDAEDMTEKFERNDKKVTVDECPGNASERKISNVSSAWSENEDFVKYESKHLQYGAYEPAGSLSSPWNLRDSKNKCFTIQVQSKNMDPVKTRNNISKNDTDIEVYVVDNSKRKEITKAETISTSPISKTNDFVSNVRKLQKQKTPVTDQDDVKQETKLFQKVFANKNKDKKRQNKLKHSKSDHNIELKQQFYFKNGRKRNIILPTKHPMITESLSSEDSFKEHSSLFSLKQKGSLDIPLVKKKPKKKKRFLKKRRSSISMPDLSFEDEKY